MKYIKLILNNKKISKYLLTLILSVFIIGGCKVEDTDNVESSNPVNTAIVNITPEDLVGDACTIGDIIVDAELIPDGSPFTIEIIDTKSTVAGCILGSDFTIQDKVATASFVVDYVLDVVRNLRVLVKITPINGAPFQTFTDILVSPIGVSISGPDTIVVDIDPEAEGDPDPIQLVFNATGLLDKVSNAEVTLSNPGIGSVDDEMPPILPDETIRFVYSPMNTPGVQVITVSLSLVTDLVLLALCPVLSPSVDITAIVTIEQNTVEMMEEEMM